MTHLQTLQETIDLLKAARDDADKFDWGNNTAGTRLRKTALEARKQLDGLRKSVQETKITRSGS